jgi:hypothetical protein
MRVVNAKVLTRNAVLLIVGACINTISDYRIRTYAIIKKWDHSVWIHALARELVRCSFQGMAIAKYIQTYTLIVSKITDDFFSELLGFRLKRSNTIWVGLLQFGLDSLQIALYKKTHQQIASKHF